MSGAWDSGAMPSDVRVPLILHQPPGMDAGLAALIGDTQRVVQELARTMPAIPPTAPPAVSVPQLGPSDAQGPPHYAAKVDNIVRTANRLSNMGEQTATVITAAGNYAGDAIRNIGTTIGRVNDQLGSVPVTDLGTGEVTVPQWAQVAIMRDLDVVLGDAHVMVTVTDHLMRTAAESIARTVVETLEP